MEKNKLPEKSRLGRGLSALIPPMGHSPVAASEDRSAPAPSVGTAPEGARELDIASITPNAFQPRTEFAPEALDDLTASIKVHGVLQPILVRPRGGGRFELIAGERRFRAAEKAGLKRVPAVVREMTDDESLIVALIENIQREDLNPIEAARGYQQLIAQFGLSQSELARQIGKAQPTINNALRLLHLPLEIQNSISEGKLTEAHGKVLLSVKDEVQQHWLAKEAEAFTWTVQQLQRAARERSSETPPKPTTKLTVQDVHWQALQNRLREALHLQVAIQANTKGEGTLTVKFSSPEDLETILDRLQ
ncbi:MAG: ParB/RepB/Spo0J family partition protein [Armatimonadota bacterium]|nr:ParB/RepB/Spo0J family partition protein [Armatimonadota bacterium]